MPKGAGNSDRSGQRINRNRNVKHALLTAVPARMSGVLLQIICLPIAAFHLGPAGFSIYAMLSASLAAMTLSSIGLGQATTLHMSQSLADRDHNQGRQVMAASIAMVSLIALAIALLTAGLALWSPLLAFLFSQHLEGQTVPLGAALFLCGIFLAVQILSVFEAAQLAQQKQHQLNIAITGGTLLAAGCVWWVASTIPSILAILIAQQLPVILFRVANAYFVMADQRPGIQDLKKAPYHARSLFVDGLRFVSGTSLSNFLCHALSVLIVGFFAAPLETASFAALMSAVLLFCSALSFVAVPFRGAMPEAFKRGDHEWLQSAMVKALGFSLAIAILAFIALAAFGERLFALWYQGSVEPSQTALIGAGAYCILLAIEVANFTYLSSVGRLRDCSRWLLLRSLTAALAVFIVARSGHEELVFWMLAITSLAFSFIPLSTMIYRLKLHTSYRNSMP